MLSLEPYHVIKFLNTLLITIGSLIQGKTIQARFLHHLKTRRTDEIRIDIFIVLSFFLNIQEKGKSWPNS